jgi:hypothetical protein
MGLLYLYLKNKAGRIFMYSKMFVFSSSSIEKITNPWLMRTENIAFLLKPEKTD